MLQFHPSNPFRPVNWRWERARLMREKHTRLTGKLKGDLYIVQAYQLQAGLMKCKDDVDRWELMEEYPDLYAAYLIFRRGDEEDRHPMRYAVEARLLSSQSPQEIAANLGVSAETVLLYEKVFFNVNEKLKNQDYIMTCVIGPSIHAGLSERDYDLLWKLFGYLYGPVVLDSFITTTSRRFRPETIGEIDAALAEDTRSSLQRKVAVVARTFTINSFSQSELLHIYTRFLEVERQAGGEKAHDMILQNIQVMMNTLPFRTGDDKLLGDNAKIAHYDTGSTELRTDELLTIATGRELPAQNELDQLKFPEPKKDD